MREKVYIVGVQCDGMCDMEKIRAARHFGRNCGLEEDGENLKVSTIYGEETMKESDALLLKCKTCKSKKLVIFDELHRRAG